MPGEKIIFLYSSYGPPKVAINPQNALYLCFGLSFSSVAIKLCPNAYILLLEHANILGIHKLLPGENIIFPYSSYGPKKWPQLLKMPFIYVYDRLLAL